MTRTSTAPNHESLLQPRSDDTPIVSVLDDDVSVRESLELLIHSAGWLPKLFESAEAFLSHPPAVVPNCLLLDFNLPDLSGLEVQKLVTLERSEMPIIFITGYGDVRAAAQAMKAGAAEFLIKPFNEDMLIGTIGQVLEQSRDALAVRSKIQILRDRHALLSQREQQVMTLVVAGLLNKQVGFELGISEITVKAHRGQVVRKMQAKSLPDLVNMATALSLT